MKKLLFSLSILLSSVLSYSQVAIGTEEQFDYGGTLNKSLFNKLRPVEKDLIKECFNKFGIENSDTCWVTFALLDELQSDYESFNRTILTGRTTDCVVSREDIIGTKKRDMSPKCMIFITREYASTHVKLQVYY